MGIDQFAERPGQSHANLGQFRQHPQMPLAAFDVARRLRHRGGVDVRVGGRDRVLKGAVEHGRGHRMNISICQVKNQDEVSFELALRRRPLHRFAVPLPRYAEED